MKLYGTITSERASKSQGGNNFLEVELSVGEPPKSNQFAIINLSRQRGDISHLDPKSYELTIVSDYKINLTNSKGKKQKGKNWQDIDIQTGETISRHE